MLHVEVVEAPQLADRRPGRLHADADRAVRVADVIKALGHPLRLRIVALLCSSEAYVGELARTLGTSQALISQQLRVLRMHGLVTAERSDGRVYYRLAEPRLQDFIGCIEGM